MVMCHRIQQAKRQALLFLKATQKELKIVITEVKISPCGINNRIELAGKKPPATMNREGQGMTGVTGMT